MRKRGKKKEKYYNNWKRITAKTLIAGTIRHIRITGITGGRTGTDAENPAEDRSSFRSR